MHTNKQCTLAAIKHMLLLVRVVVLLLLRLLLLQGRLLLLLLLLLLLCSPHVYDVVGLPKHGGACAGALDAVAKEDLLTAVQHNPCVPNTFNLQ
jgi:hypothetical protein